MKATVLRFLVPLLLIAAAGGPAAGTDHEQALQVDAVFAEWDTTASPGCALAVIRDGAVVYARGYGMANLEHHLAITPRSVFRIGSTSKQFTAATLVLLAEQGALSLDDDVRKYVPELPEYETPITVRHLIHHTSGLRDYLELMWLAGHRDADYYTDDDVVAMLARQHALNFKPGDEHLYSNSGYFLLSVIVLRATGHTLAETADELIFKPLGMRHTHFHDDHRQIVEDRADGYQRTDDGGFEISKTTLEMVGDGGVFTTVEDLFLWDQNFYGNRLGGGGPAFLEQLHTRGTLNDGERLSYAFGLEVGDYRGLKTVSHGGSFVGYRAELLRFPDERFSVVCLCNLAGTNPSRLALQVADVYLADRLQPMDATAAPEGATVEVSAAALARLAGRYFERDSGLLRTIEAREGKLFYVRGGGSETELGPLGDDRFRMLGVPARVEVRFEPPAAEADVPLRMVVTVDDNPPGVFERVDPVSYSPEELAAITGPYANDELDVTYQVAAGDDGLSVTPGRGKPFELTPALRDVFTGPLTLELTRGADGGVSGFTVAAGRVRGLRFVRAETISPAAAAGSPAESWQCRNDLEVRCGAGTCAAAAGGEFTPMSVSVADSGAMSVCAYSGCWEGTGEVVRSGRFLVLIGHDLKFSTAPDADTSGEDIVIAIDREDGVATLKAGAFANPLWCESGP